MVVGFGTNNNGVLGMKFLDKFKAFLRTTPTSASHFVLVVFCSELVTGDLLAARRIVAFLRG
jgi:hypothetical protein